MQRLSEGKLKMSDSHSGIRSPLRVPLQHTLWYLLSHCLSLRQESLTSYALKHSGTVSPSTVFHPHALQQLPQLPFYVRQNPILLFCHLEVPLCLCIHQEWYLSSLIPASFFLHVHSSFFPPASSDSMIIL